jgi:hypothetical protein
VQLHHLLSGERSAEMAQKHQRHRC